MRERDRSAGFPVLAVLGSAYLLTRLALLLCSENRTSTGEMFYIGSISHGILHGWAVPFWDFQHMPDSGGYLVNGLLAVPLFFFFGPGALSLYILAIAISLCGLILLFYLSRKYYGRLAAIFAVLLYIFSPPLMTGFSVICEGDLQESVVLGLALFFLFLNLMRTRKSRDYFWLGLASGFAVWYSYINLVTICGYTFLWFFRDRLFFFRKPYRLYLAGLFAGFLPWFVYNSRNGYAGLGILINDGVSRSDIWLKFRGLISEGWRGMFLFDQFSPSAGNWFNSIYYGIFLISALYLIWLGLSGKGKREWELLLFPLSFAALYSLSDKRFYDTGWGLFDYRYALVIFVFVLLIVAVALARVCEYRSPAFKAGGGLAFAALIFIGIFGNGGYFISTDFRNLNLSRPGYYYILAGEVAFRRQGSDLAKVARIIGSVPSEAGREDAYLGYGKTLATSRGPAGAEEALRIGERIKPASCREMYYWGLGEGLVEHEYSPGYGKKLRILYQGISGWPREARVYAGCGMLALVFHFTASSSDFPDALSAFPAEFRKPAFFFYGYGEGINYFICPLGRDKRLDAGRRIAGNFSGRVYTRDFDTGLAAGIAMVFNGDMSKAGRYYRNLGLEEEAVKSAEGLYRFDPKVSGSERRAWDAVVAMAGGGN